MRFPYFYIPGFILVFASAAAVAYAGVLGREPAWFALAALIVFMGLLVLMRTKE